MRGQLVLALLATSVSLSLQLGNSPTPVCPGNTTADQVLANVNLTGNVAIVTGGDSGLGLAMAVGLAKRGATVIIATHNYSKGREVAAKIRNEYKVDVRAPWPLNLASLDSVRSFAASFLSEFGLKLHLLINNAGIGGPSKLDSDGYELVFEVDYLGHFLLTEMLLPALRESRPSRVVNVASGAHENACEAAGWPEGCFANFSYLPPPVVPRRPVTVHYRTGAATVNASSYGIAKFLQTQHAAELALRESHNGVQAFSLTPGFALTSMTSHFDPNDPTVKNICKQQVHPRPELPANPCPFTAEQGAAVIAYCAVGNATNGAYFSRTLACGESPIVTHGMTQTTRHELYERSLHWAGLDRLQLVSV